MDMNERTRTAGLASLGLWVALGAAASLPAQENGKDLPGRAKGTFGLGGTMAIVIGEDEPRQSYDFQYTLPPAP
jgi:hypothetical protein